MKIVDESNPIPKYLQISTWLRELIQAGRYQPGERLPSEVQLSKMCGVNRNTLRQAIAELTSAGLLRKEKGMGTFVTSREPGELRHKLERISSFRDVMRASGISEKTRILEKKVENAPEPVARALFLRPEQKVVVVRRVRSGRRIAYIYEESYLPHDMFAEILNMDLTGSMYELISEQFHVSLARCKQTIGAVNLDKRVAALLGLPENAAAIFIESLTFNENNLPIEVLYSYHRGDKYKLEIELGRYHQEGGRITHFAER